MSVNEYGFTAEEVDFIYDSLGLNNKHVRRGAYMYRIFNHSKKKIRLHGGYDFSEIPEELATIFYDYIALHEDGFKNSDHLNKREFSLIYKNLDDFSKFAKGEIDCIDLESNNKDKSVCYCLYRHTDKTFWIASINIGVNVKDVVFKQVTTRHITREFGISRMAPNKIPLKNIFSYDFVDYVINDPELPPKEIITMDDMYKIFKSHPELFVGNEHLMFPEFMDENIDSSMDV